MTWIKEREAAEKVQRHPRTLRRKVKSGKWNVSYRTVDGKTYQYDAKALEKVFETVLIK